MTQKQTVLAMLKAGGGFGVLSNAFYRDDVRVPRAAVRIEELKAEGHEISSVREGKFTRYTLVGSSAEGRGQAERRTYSPANATPSVASSEAGVAASQLRPGASGEPGTSRSVPSMFDADDCLDWNRAA